MKKKKVSNIMLVVIVIAIVGYSIANFVLQYHMGIEMSPTLTTCWFSFWSVEICAITGIKLTKIKNNITSANYDNSSEDES